MRTPRARSMVILSNVTVFRVTLEMARHVSIWMSASLALTRVTSTPIVTIVLGRTNVSVSRVMKAMADKSVPSVTSAYWASICVTKKRIVLIWTISTDAIVGQDIKVRIALRLKS